MRFNFLRRLRNQEAAAGAAPAATAAPAPAPATDGGQPAVTDPAAPSAPQFDPNVDPAEQMKGWSMEQLNHFIEHGTLPGQPAAPAAPDPSAAPEKKEGDDPAAPPADDALTSEMIEKAPPAIQKLYDDHVSTLEKVVSLEQEVETLRGGVVKNANDPIIKMRNQMIEQGRVEVPLDFDPEINIDKLVEETGLLDALANEADDKRAVALVANAIRNALGPAMKEMAFRAQANIEMGQEDAIKIGESRATFRYEVRQVLDAVPEWKASGKPAFIQRDGRDAANPEHPGFEFVKWLSEQAQAGALTDAAAKNFGMDSLFHIWKSRQAGGLGAHMASIKKSAAQEALDQMRGIKRGAFAQSAAPTVGAGGTTGGGGGTQFHGFILEELMANPVLANQALDAWGKQSGGKAIIDEYIEKITPR